MSNTIHTLSIKCTLLIREIKCPYKLSYSDEYTTNSWRVSESWSNTTNVHSFSNQRT